MSTSTELLRSYLRERYRARLFVPLALILGVTGMIAAGARVDSLVVLIESTLAAYFLVLGFRVWDDLEDRSRDRAAHPERVLVRATDTAPWITLLIASFLIATALIASGPAALLRLALLAVVAGTLVLWYRTRRFVPNNALTGTAVIFAKYPIIAFVAAPPSRPPSIAMTTTILVALYVALCTYELIDDPALRGSTP